MGYSVVCNDEIVVLRVYETGTFVGLAGIRGHGRPLGHSVEPVDGLDRERRFGKFLHRSVRWFWTSLQLAERRVTAGTS